MDKAAWRASLLAARRALAGSERAEQARLLAETVRTCALGETVCAYLPVGSEPGDVSMLDALRAGGAQVLLPVIDGPVLNWAPYDGRLREAEFGLQEPRAAPLGHGAIATATAMLVPALAVDGAGVRIGKGGGYYDRTLAELRASACPLIAVVRDEEVVEQLPAEPHDVRMTHALTPNAGLRAL